MCREYMRSSVTTEKDLLLVGVHPISEVVILHQKEGSKGNFKEEMLN